MEHKVKQLLVLFLFQIIVLSACAAPSHSVRDLEDQQNDVTSQQKKSSKAEVLSHSIESVHNSETTLTREDVNQENSIQESNEPDQTEFNSKEEPISQPSELSYEDFQGFYVTFTGDIYNSRPETIVEILPDEVRIGWPESEYILYQVIGHTLNGNLMTVQTNEIGLNGIIVDQHTFEFSLDTRQDSKILSSNGIDSYLISQEDYNRLVEYSYAY